MSKYIQLTKGMKVLVDDEWFPILSRWKWQYTSSGYAGKKLGSSKGATHVFMHRYITMAGPKQVVDHINGDRLDNRMCNLRLVKPHANYFNRGKQANNTTGYKGVCYDKNRKKFLASISAHGKQRNIGRFDTAVEAAKAYDIVAKELHGENARFNFPQD